MIYLCLYYIGIIVLVEEDTCYQKRESTLLFIYSVCVKIEIQYV